jgi:hypothetical protein
LEAGLCGSKQLDVFGVEGSLGLLVGLERAVSHEVGYRTFNVSQGTRFAKQIVDVGSR